MKLTAVSDLHGTYPKDLPGGDLLIVAGDLTSRNRVPQYKEFFNWFGKQQYTKKVLVAGNHDKYLQSCLNTEQSRNLGLWEEEGYEYLCDSGIEFMGYKIWGAPWTKWFRQVNPECDAFMLQMNENLQQKWEMIPSDTDILVTHGPPKGVLDESVYAERCGCSELRKRVEQLTLTAHFFGHIHEGYGTYCGTDIGLKCKFYNIAHMDAYYDAKNRPVTLELDSKIGSLAHR